MTERDLAGMVAVITGAGSGVGRAVAMALAAAGGTPVLVGRTREPLWETAAVVAGAGGHSLVRPADVTDEAAVEEVFAQAADELEGTDAATLAAGVGRYGPVESYPRADWEETLATNLTGPFLCAKAAIPHLRRNGGGAIVAVSSGAGKQGYPQLGAYSASKFGLMGLMQGLAADAAAGRALDDGRGSARLLPRRGVVRNERDADCAHPRLRHLRPLSGTDRGSTRVTLPDARAGSAGAWVQREAAPTARYPRAGRGAGRLSRRRRCPARGRPRQLDRVSGRRRVRPPVSRSHQVRDPRVAGRRSPQQATWAGSCAAGARGRRVSARSTVAGTDGA